MAASEQSSPLLDIVAARRLSRGATGSRRGFTVERTRALLEMRAQPQQGAWHWTLGLVRAANVLSPRAEGSAQQRERGDEIETELVFAVPDADFSALDLAGLLPAALEIDVGTSVIEGAGGQLSGRWRRLVAGAINTGLAHDPLAIELVTPRGGRIFERVQDPRDGRDPYREHATRDATPRDAFVVRVRAARRGLGSRLGGWLVGAAADLEELERTWHAALLGSNDRQRIGEGIALGWTLPGRRVRLGDHATWGRVPEMRTPWLVRDGVRLLSLEPVLRSAGLHALDFAGWIDCAALRLTADDGAVVEDASLELLLAWLHDARAHTFDDDGGERRVIWPTELAHVSAASGRLVTLDEVRERAVHGGDMLYVWPNRAAAVPGGLRPKVLRLWPSERPLLERAVPQLRLVPLRALGDTPQLDRVDLSGLRHGSLPPLEVPVSEQPEIVTADGVPLRIRLDAYVHRDPTATTGEIVLLAYDRRVAHMRDASRVIPAVTLVARVDTAAGVDVGDLKGDVDALREVAARCREAAEARHEDLLVHAFRRSGNPWENPLVRGALDDIGGCVLGLRYAADGHGGLRLRWRDTVLLELAVGRTVGGEARNLREALIRCRDVGGVVVTSASSRWRTLESSDPDHEPWVLSAHGRDLVERTLGTEVLWEMPTVPRSFPSVAPAAAQSHLAIDRDEAERLLGRSMGSRTARARLLGHVLVARAGGRDEHGLAEVGLLRHYDGRAVAPTRLVSVATVLAEHPRPGLAFPGAVSRDLRDPVLEVTPGEAALLHEVLGLQPGMAPKAGAAPRRRAADPVAPVRRRGRSARPLVSMPVVRPALVGTVGIEPEGTAGGVAVWGDGVHLDDVELPGPLARVSGRLWLTRGKGHAPTGSHDWLETEVGAVARELVALAVRHAPLMPPGGRRRGDLDRFLSRCRDHVVDGDALRLARALSAGHVPRARPDPMGSLARDPLQPLPPVRRRWLAALVGQALVARGVKIDTAWLSWDPAEVVIRDGRLVEIQLGRRHGWIGRAVVDEPELGAVFEATCLVVGEVLRDVRRESSTLAPRGAEQVALYRVLAMAFAMLG